MNAALIQELKVNRSIFNGYHSMPISVKGIGHLLFHSWWGLNEIILQTCDQMVQAGFVALAPDYYGGETAETIEVAKAFKQNFNRKIAN